MRLNSRISSGIAITTTQAPARNLVKRKIRVATAVTTAPVPLMTARRDHPRSRVRHQCTTSPACERVNPVNTPMANKRDEGVGVAAHRDEQCGRKAGECQHAVPEHETAVSDAEEMGQVVVSREQARQHRHPAEGGVRRQRQHQGDGQRDDVVGPVPPDRLGHDLAEHGLVRARLDMELVGEHREPEQHRAEDHAEQELGPLCPGHAGSLEQRARRSRWPRRRSGRCTRPRRPSARAARRPPPASAWRPATCRAGGVPAPSGWTRPMAMIASRPTMKTSVGTRKARALSPSPLRLSAVMTASIPRQIGTVAETVEGNAEVSCPTPAAMETATVRV